MVTMHTNTGTPLTKLMILQNAVNVITSLEQQVRGNLAMAQNTFLFRFKWLQFLVQ